MSPIVAREPKPRTWGALAEPVDPIETLRRMRAQSIMCSGEKFRDGSSQAPPLTLDEAKTVLKWARDPLAC